MELLSRDGMSYADRPWTEVDVIVVFRHCHGPSKSTTRTDDLVSHKMFFTDDAIGNSSTQPVISRCCQRLKWCFLTLRPIKKVQRPDRSEIRIRNRIETATSRTIQKKVDMNLPADLTARRSVKPSTYYVFKQNDSEPLAKFVTEYPHGDVTLMLSARTYENWRLLLTSFIDKHHEILLTCVFIPTPSQVEQLHGLGFTSTRDRHVFNLRT